MELSSEDGCWSLVLGVEGTAVVVVVVVTVVDEWIFLRATTGDKEEVRGSMGCGCVARERVSYTWRAEEEDGGSAGWDVPEFSKEADLLSSLLVILVRASVTFFLVRLERLLSLFLTRDS